MRVAANNAFRMGNNSFGAMGSNSMGQRSMPGLGQQAGVPGQTSGLGLGQTGAAGPLNGALGGAGRLGGGGGANFGAMQGQQPSYNPSGEILAMINKGQGLGLGLPPSQPLGGMGGGMSGALPQALSQPGMPGSQVGQGGPGGLGLGMPGAPDLTGQMGGVPASPSFDMNDFPSLGQRTTSAPSACSQQFRGPGGGMGAVGGMGPPPPVQPDFAIQNEDFPALPGAAPASSSLTSSGGEVGVMGGSAGPMGAFRNPAVESGVEALLGSATAKEATGADGSAGGSGLAGFGGGSGSGASTDRYGLMGLLNVIRASDQDLNTLALGTDLTTLGLNLNSSECLYATFASPWADAPAQRDPEFSLPQCYYMQPPALKTGHFSKFRLETLFYIFYNMPRDTLQAYAATELYNRDWRYHKDLKLWFTKASRQGAAETQKGQYIYFDIHEWKKKLFRPENAGGSNGTDVEGESAAGIEDL